MCLTDTSLYIYICVKHFGMANIKEKLPHNIQKPGNYPEGGIQHSEHGESLKSRILHLFGEEIARHPRLIGKLGIRAYKIQTPGELPRRKLTTST